MGPSNSRAGVPRTLYKGVMDVTITQQPELRVAGIRHIGPYMEIGREFGRLGALLNGPPPAGAQMIAIYYDDPDVTPADKLRADAALMMPGHTPSPPGLIEHRIPGGRYARAIHRGGYETLPATWHALKTEWLPKSGHAMGHPSYEIYVNNPTNAKKDDLITEVYLRLD
jgi:AraC family transcriptional regulator